MDLSSNHLTGEVPVEVGNMKNLKALFLSANKLSGGIPGTLGNCEVLEALLIDNNFLQGTIPPSLSGIKGLQYLDLSYNNLSGPIPELLENLKFLVSLNLSFNHLDGAVPTKGIFKNATDILLLGNDGLCGGIAELHLPACPKRSTEKSRKSHLVLVVIPIITAISCLILISLFVFFYCKKYSRTDARPESSLDERYQRVSYKDLAEATDGFSSTNLVGTGRYGSVYKGSMPCNNSAVAVKVFDLQQLGAFKSFIAECEALRIIRHRNLVKIITLCTSIDFRGHDFKALVFEFMPNGSLEAWLHPGINEHGQMNVLNLRQRLNIAIDIAEAMDYLHHGCEPPVVHCDLKPTNVLLDDNMVAHVGDFGLAKILSEAMSMPLQNSVSSIGIRGSIGYIPPEYGTGGQVSTSGDVYSYGILLLEIFTGKRPVDDAFENGLTLHDFVELSFPERIMEIIDPLLLIQDGRDDPEGSTAGRIHQFLLSVVRIGLSCSAVSPGERMNMRNVASAMHAIRNSCYGGRG